jgi:hypothetical protein
VGDRLRYVLSPALEHHHFTNLVVMMFSSGHKLGIGVTDLILLSCRIR